MSTISILKKSTMEKFNALQEEYKKEIYSYLESHNLNKNVIRLSDKKVGRIKLCKGNGYILGKLAFYPLKKNGEVSTKKERYVNESMILEQYRPYNINL